MSNIVALVPIRHASQRVPGKNYRLLGKRPLYEYVMDTLIKSRVEKIVVDTNSEKIVGGLADKYSSEIMSGRMVISSRPEELCEATISMNRIIGSVIERFPEVFKDETVIFQTHVTNPFLTVESVNGAIEKYIAISNWGGSMISVTGYQNRLWKENGEAINHDPNVLIQTQDLPKLYEENSNFYVFRVGTYRKRNNRLGDRGVMFYELDKIEAWDIDTEKDFEMAQMILEKSNKINGELLNVLKKELNTEIEIYMEKMREMSDGHSVMISAPYMMKDIETFKNFYERLNVNVVVADVKERLSSKDLVEYHHMYDVALIGDDGYNGETIRNSGVKALCKWGTGIDSIDQEYCRKNGVGVYNTPNAFSVPVAQSIMSAILGFMRTTFGSNEMMKNSDRWVKLQGRTLEEITVGIVGLGNIGSTLAGYLRGFGTRILGNDINEGIRLDGVENVTLEGLLRNSDVVCMCTTLNPTSNHIINEHTIKMMKRGGYLINMARGPLVEQKCLIEAIKNGHLAGAALDVFEEEPLPRVSEFREFKNVIISSHNTNSSPKYWERVHINTIRNSLKALIKICEEK